MLTLDQEEEVERRILHHKNGESKSYSWSEVKSRADDESALLSKI